MGLQAIRVPPGPPLSPQKHPPSATATAAVAAAGPPEAISRWRIDVSSSKNNRRMKPVGKFSLLYSSRSKCVCISQAVAVFLAIVIELAHTWEIKLVTFGLSFR